MGKLSTSLTPVLEEFIKDQKIFFVATAMGTGPVNLSPKGMDTLRILSPTQVAWLNLTGSGNETAAHLLENNRMTMMFCAFEGKPLILRLYGEAIVYHPRDPQWQEFISLFPTLSGSRQIFVLNISMVQTSCGMAVPFMDFNKDRMALNDWAEKQGDDGIEAYWERKNKKSLDGHETDIFK